MKKPSEKQSNRQSKHSEDSGGQAIETGRGTIQDNFLAALVTSKVYRSQVVRLKKGKGSYQRKQKHKSKGRESYPIAALNSSYWIGLSPVCEIT